MSIDPRLERSTEHLVSALDAHLFTLRSHLPKLRDGPSYLKVVSAELRVLICKSARIEGLLWRLVKALEVDDTISLNLPGKFNSAHPLMTDLTFMIAPLSRGHKPHPHFEQGVFSLKSVIKETNALIAEGEPLTHEKLISSVAQQLGSAHEADRLDPALIQLNSIFIDGTDPIAMVLAFDTALVLEVGERVLLKAEEKLNFVRSQHEHDYGNLTIATGFYVRKLPDEPMRLFSLKSFVSSVSIEYFISSTGGYINIKQKEQLVFQRDFPCDAPQTSYWAFLEALSYCSRSQQIRIFSNDENGKPEKIVIDCTLGWLHVVDFEVELAPINEFFEVKFFLSFCKLLSSEQIHDIATKPIFTSETELAQQGFFPD